MPSITHFFIFILLILISEMSLGISYGGQVGSMQEGIKPEDPLNKVSSRKVMVEVTLDYDTGGANCKHDPKKGKNCGGGPGGKSR